MCRYVPVTDSLFSVRGDNDTPTGVMVLAPIHEIGGHKVAIGATTSPTGEREYGVVIDGEMSKDHRSNTPPLGALGIHGDGKTAQVFLRGEVVASLKLA